MKNKAKTILRARRHGRVRAKISGTEARPRLSVFRSLAHISAQVINDEKGVTLVSVCDCEIKDVKGKKKVALAREAGKLLAEKAKAKKIEAVVFDKGHAKFHGRVKELAEGAREGGLKF